MVMRASSEALNAHTGDGDSENLRAAREPSRQSSITVFAEAVVEVRLRKSTETSAIDLSAGETRYET